MLDLCIFLSWFGQDYFFTEESIIIDYYIIIDYTVWACILAQKQRF